LTRAQFRRAFLLALLDGETGCPLSTVELKVTRSRKNGAVASEWSSTLRKPTPPRPPRALTRSS